MTHSLSWEANRFFLASQEIPRISWNSKVHYLIQKCPLPVPILSQLDPVHTPIAHFLKIQLNIILPSTPGSPKWSLSFRFPHQNPIYALHTPPISFFSILSPEQFGWGIQIVKLLLMYFSPPRCYLVLLTPLLNIIHIPFFVQMLDDISDHTGLPTIITQH